jgi:hypothetical protein
MPVSSIEYGDKKIATHSFIEGSEERHTERITAGAGVLEYNWTSGVEASAAGLLAGLSRNVVGKGRIAVLGKTTAAAASLFTFRLVYYSTATPSTAGILGLSALITCAVSGLPDNAVPLRRFAPAAIFANDIGASCVGIYVESLPGGLPVIFGLGTL